MISQRTNALVRAAGLIFACVGLASGSVVPTVVSGADLEVIGARTQGGLKPGAHVIHVSSLDDSGQGSLRAALDATGPRVIVFDVSGLIHLGTPLKIIDPDITIAGETAPAPGITLLGAPLIISTHDVIVEHLAIRPGPPSDPSRARLQDGVIIQGALDGSRPTYDILLRNLSVSWAVDKGITIWRPDKRRFQTDTIRPSETTRVTVKDCIVSEMLDDAGHPKGEHSMGLLIFRGVQGVEVRGVLFAHNRWRNPVIGTGAEAYVVNNLIYDPGNVAIHFYTHLPEDGPTRADVENNLVIAGPSSKRNLAAVKIPPGGTLDLPGTQIYLAGNSLGGHEGVYDALDARGLVRRSPLHPSDPPAPVSTVRRDVLLYAGYRPGQRDGVDARIVREVNAGTGGIINNIGERASGLPKGGRTQVSQPPSDPATLGRWLCQKRMEVGGRPEAC